MTNYLAPNLKLGQKIYDTSVSYDKNEGRGKRVFKNLYCFGKDLAHGDKCACLYQRGKIIGQKGCEKAPWKS